MRLPVCQTQTGVTHDDVDLLSGLVKVKLDETGIIKANSLNTILGFDTGENGDGDKKKSHQAPSRFPNATFPSPKAAREPVGTGFGPVTTRPRGREGSWVFLCAIFDAKACHVTALNIFILSKTVSRRVRC